MTAKEYQEKTGMKVIDPTPDSYVIATDAEGVPMVWAKMIRWKRKDLVRWIITQDPSLRAYMFKDDGLFGFSPDRNEVWENSFEFLDEAINCFRQFYSPVRAERIGGAK